ncbi:ef hand family protein [Stylonychia lemnae]|uniref:Ef hand family protein n=1 Tax=Stylonychia lemnae TaxID=5949 RepID=A0A078B2R5_STYLE|nr:ef hand family protein [Stylonychia lemnae]|eukprot:CDW87512.1 ef hand family protein [Stylonychia lemnae]
MGSSDYGLESPIKKINARKDMRNGSDQLTNFAKSLQELPQINETQNGWYLNKSNNEQLELTSIMSPKAQSRFSDVSKSTSFSRPFTCVSFVSSTTVGTSLTQKIERLNKVSLKSTAKHLIQCSKQIEQALRNNRLTLKSMLTVPEIVMYLHNTDVNLSLSQLQNVLVGVLLIQRINSDFQISIKTILKSCQNYVDQCEIEHKDFFNKSKSDKIIDEIRDYIYNKGLELRVLFQRSTESDNDNYEKTVMTLEQFTTFIKNIVSDKFSTRDVETVYRNLVSQKPFNYKRFKKNFRYIQILFITYSPQPVDDIWFNTGLKIIRDYIIKKKSSSQEAFERFILMLGSKDQPRLTKYQFRDIMKRENLPFSLAQIDFLFSKFDQNNDGYIDLNKWQQFIQDDHDILYKMGKRLMDAPLNFTQFKECIMKVDSSLNPLQIKSLYELLKNSDDNKVEVAQIIKNLTGEQADTVNFKKIMTKRIQDYLTKNQLLISIRAKFQEADRNNEGLVTPEQLLKILLDIKVPALKLELEKYIRQIKKNQKGLIYYQKLVQTFENQKENFPLKSLGVRLAVFLKQNNLDHRSLIAKLIQTKNQSKSNKKQSRDDKSINLDNRIGESDMQNFLARINFHDFFDDQSTSTAILSTPEKGSNSFSNRLLQSSSHLSRTGFGGYSTSSAATMSFIGSHMEQASNKKLFPTENLVGDKLVEVVNKVRNDLKHKGLNPIQGFQKLDINQTGLISYPVFSEQIDKFSTLSEAIKEKLFAQMDHLKTGLISSEQFCDLFNKSITVLRDPIQTHIADTFDWEQTVIKEIKQWIVEKNYSSTEAFKIIDQDFDGNISIEDLKGFLLQVMKLENEDIQNTKLNRLYKILDISKTDKIFPSDFEGVYSSILQLQTNARDENGKTTTFRSRILQNQQSALNKSQKQDDLNTFNWQIGCIYQIGKFISEKYSTLQESFENIVSQQREQELKIRYGDFLNFINKYNVLNGFNLTNQLLQKLFAAMDPHRKGYLTMNDWKLHFSEFKNIETKLLDIKGALTATFNSVQQAFQFMIDKSKSSEINFEGFKKTMDQVLPGRHQQSQLQLIWDSIVGQGLVFKSDSQMHDMINKHLLKTSMSKSISIINTRGNLRNQSALTNNSQNPGYTNITQMLLQNQNQLYSKLQQSPDQIKNSQASHELRAATFFSNMIDPVTQQKISNDLTLDRLRKNLQAMGVTNLKELCQANANGKTSSIEFKNSMKRLNINSKDIDRLMEVLVIDEELIDLRGNNRLKGLKKMMYEQMTSPEDAFRFFDKEGKGRLTYNDFQSLISNLYQLQSDEPPTYPIIKDMFDQIDIRKDGIIDINEWTKTFLSQQAQVSRSMQGFAKRGGSMQPRSENEMINMSSWVSSKDYTNLLNLITKNKKALEKLYKESLNQDGFIRFEEAKKLLIDFLRKQMLNENAIQLKLEDWQIQQIASPFQELKHGDFIMNYQKMLDTIKDRHRVLAGFPKIFEQINIR